jgi:hypothetical protein
VIMMFFPGMRYALSSIILDDKSKFRTLAKKPNHLLSNS